MYEMRLYGKYVVFSDGHVYGEEPCYSHTELKLGDQKPIGGGTFSAFKSKFEFPHVMQTNLRSQTFGDLSESHIPAIEEWLNQLLRGRGEELDEWRIDFGL